MQIAHICHIIYIEEANGTLTPVKSNPAVPVEMLKKVHNLLKSGISIEDVVDRLRTETVPKGYPCHPWLSGVYVMYYAQHVYVVWWYMYIVCVCLCVCMCVHLHAYICLLVVA